MDNFYTPRERRARRFLWCALCAFTSTTIGLVTTLTTLPLVEVPPLENTLLSHSNPKGVLLTALLCMATATSFMAAIASAWLLLLGSRRYIRLRARAEEDAVMMDLM